MTGEQFHDALTLLPEDLIARADEVRSRKPKTLHWRRYVSLAACCALLVLCGVLYQNQPVKTASNEMTKVFSAADSPAEMAPAPASGDLGAMDAEIAALETKLAKARHVKQGMMQELLTGKTRLSV